MSNSFERGGIHTKTAVGSVGVTGQERKRAYEKAGKEAEMASTWILRKREHGWMRN